MSFAAVNKVHREKYVDGAWTASDDEVVAFARDMVAADFITTADGLQEYYEKPWHWNREHEWWVANDRPDNWETWDKGIDTDWEVAA